MSKELKPCPFCGGNAKLTNVSIMIKCRSVAKIECVQCGANLEISEYDRNIVKKAIKKWNTRKPMDEIVERLEEQLEGHKQYLEFEMESAVRHCIEIVKGGAE